MFLRSGPVGSKPASHFLGSAPGSEQGSSASGSGMRRGTFLFVYLEKLLQKLERRSAWRRVSTNRIGKWLQ
jgi:hypothetical protein